MINNREIIEKIAATICNEYQFSEHREQLTISIPSANIIDFMSEIKMNPDTSFDMLMDITAIDWAKRKDRFEVVYFLYSNKFKSRLRVKIKSQEKNPVVPSVTGVWESANWYERETFDMYGIKFEGHPNLRRFYMPEDFNDPVTGEQLFPLRKDFPLMGIPESLPLPPFPERDGELK